MHLQERLGMCWNLRLHRVDHTQLVRMSRQFGEEVRDPQATGTAWSEFPGRGQQFRPRSTPGPACILEQLGFVIQRIDMRRPTTHAQKDDVLRGRRKMGTGSTLATPNAVGKIVER
ncbi:MAG: hypothetical protein KatS3mg111_3579 [Pirellulaceae bacterium]|nr:MAG: hypothetical protein KatS3mg111_3579 [Pirellulaceae bacterium]